MTANDRNQYNSMENALQKINSDYISLSPGEKSRNNRILKEILNDLISEMKHQDVLFKSMYSRLFYGGSYYDGLRVGSPEEFDLDLLLVLPKYSEPTIAISSVPGFVHVQLKALYKFLRQPEAITYKYLVKLLDDDHYIKSTSVLSWMERVIIRALNEFPGNSYASLFSTSAGTFEGTLHKSGPALTLQLRGTVGGSRLSIDVDLVPCFIFTKSHWPPLPYLQYTEDNMSDFFIVPKRPLSAPGAIELYWRLSFQEQERKLMNDRRTFKPTLRLLKQLRDKEGFTVIASYYIKTVFLWEIENNYDLFATYSLSYLFMFMLRKLQERIQQKNIPYFWNAECNLLASVHPNTLENISYRLLRIIKHIEQNFNNDSFDIERYLGTNRTNQIPIGNINPVVTYLPPEANENSSWCTIL